MAIKRRTPRPSQSTAIVRAQHHELPAHLSTTERSVLQEALRRGADLSDDVQSAVVSYGRWLLGAVFAEDSTAALDTRSKNPVWLELVRRAGGPTLALSRRMLYVALALAAHDKRIGDQAWRGLDAGRKELLLPLGEESRMREAARHVAQFNLSQAGTRNYVTGLLREGGRPRQVRVTIPGVMSKVKKLQASLGERAVLRRIGELRQELAPAERTKAAEEIEALGEVLAQLARTLRSGR